MRESNNYKATKKTLECLGSICLVIAPLLTFIGWTLPHENFNDFLQFNISRNPTDATTTLDRNNLAQVYRYYYLPHYFIYVSMLFYAGLGIYLAYLIRKTRPILALTGSILVVVGAIYFVGVLGAFLSIPIGTINQTNILKISFGLSTFVFIGQIVLAVGLFKSQLLSKMKTTIYLLGIITIIVFPGIENWMALGSLLILVGLVPLSTFGPKSNFNKC